MISRLVNILVYSCLFLLFFECVSVYKLCLSLFSSKKVEKNNRYIYMCKHIFVVNIINIFNSLNDKYCACMQFNSKQIMFK